MLIPESVPALWVVLIGIGPMLFAIVQVLFNLRTRDDDAVTVRVSGFVQGVGYVLGAAGPLTFGILHDSTGARTAPLVFLLAPSLAGILLRQRGMVDDELGLEPEPRR